MCDVVSAVIGAVSGIASLFGGSSKSSSPQVIMPQIQQYVPSAENTPAVTAPPPPTATPTMGQGSAEDLQKDAADAQAKKKKRGRAGLRIDREPTAIPPAGGAVASGAVVPKG